MPEDTYSRRLTDKLKKALDDVEARGGRKDLADRLRQIYEMALADEKLFQPNRRATGAGAPSRFDYE